MNKRKVVLTSLLGFTLLFGCSQVEDGEVSANVPEEFSKVGDFRLGNVDYVEVQHIETKCHYLFKTNDIEQMFIEKDGVSVPYCDR